MNRIKVERAIDGLTEWQKHVQTNSDIDRNIFTAIDALKAQLSQQGTTKDTISRTETAEHLRRVLDATVPITDYDEGYVDGVEVGISTVSTMPTVQPQSTVGQLNDGVQSTNLIDRQAAIRWVKTECNPYGKPTLDFESGKKVIEHLEQMPPAQPEPTDINAKEAVYNLAEKIGIHQLFALTVELRGEPIQPEPHEGHWIDKGWDGDWAWQIDGHGNCWRVIECSECGKGVSVESNYCPHCGARMKGDANGKGN